MKRADLQALTRRSWKQLSVVVVLSLATAASVNGAPRSRITPYLEYQQVLNADLNDGDALTYSAIGAGIDGTIATRRVQATISYNYQRRIAWDEALADDDVHSGLAAVRLEAVPGVLSVEAGAMAARTSADPRLALPALRTSDDARVAEVYSLYAGPTLTTHAGPVALGASYRLGYVKVDDHSLAGDGTRRPERYDSSVVHNASVSAGMEPGELPFGWTVGAGWSREEMERLDSTFDGKYARGDIVVPVSPTLALTAGVGYEDIRSSQSDFLRDANGVPIVTPDGELIPDPSKPRLLAYDDSGLFWDAGVIWRPTPRTELQARVGRRYGGTTFTGSLEHRINRDYAFTAAVYDSVDSFGRLLVTDLAGVPRQFSVKSNPITGISGVGGCVFGNEAGTGVCFDDALQSVSNFNFRNRGANVLLSGTRGLWSGGLGAAYNQRRYLAPPGPDFAVRGTTDESVTVNANATRRLSRTSSISYDLFGSWFDSDLAGSESSYTAGVSSAYNRSIFHERLQASLAAGIYRTDTGDEDQSVGSILFGLRYSF